MSMESTARPLAEQFSDIRWGAVIAGAVAAAALAFVLEGFALGIGFAVSSTAPTWRDTSFALVLASGIYLVLVALAAYAFGGYVAARAYRPVTAGTVEAGEFRDGLHGLVVWGLGTLLTALLALGAVQATAHLAAPSGSAAASNDGDLIQEIEQMQSSEGRPGEATRPGSDTSVPAAGFTDGTAAASQAGACKTSRLGSCARTRRSAPDPPMAPPGPRRWTTRS